MFEDIKRSELEQINGGGVAGAIAGYAIGCYVGAVVGSVCAAYSKKLGDSDAVASDVGGVAFATTVVIFTTFGALLPTP